MSNLNNFMKNNKGYYSWIHSLKQAAMESQAKGVEMITEAKRGKMEAGMDLAAKAQIDAEIRSRGERKALSARELAAGGDADYVAAEAGEDEDADHIPDIADPDSGKLPTFNVPATPVTIQHPEPMYKSAAEAEAAVRAHNQARHGHLTQKAADFAGAVQAGRETAQEARKKGMLPKSVKSAVKKRIEDYKASKKAEREEEAPERFEEVITPEGHRMHMPMESVNDKINRFLKD
jgi:hypothetical protein